MCRRLAVLATLALATVAVAGDWKEPEDKALHEREVKDYVVYLQALKKVGGKWHEQTRYVTSDVEKKALNESAVDRDEVHFAAARVHLIARQLVIETAPADTLDKAEKAANEKLAQAQKKMDEIMKSGPKELGELDKVETELARAERASSDFFVATLIASIKLGAYEKEMAGVAKDPEKRKALQDKIEATTAQKNQVEDSAIEEARKMDTARRERLDLVDKLKSVGATDGLKQIEVAREARRDQEEVAAAKKDKAAAKKLDPALEPSIAVVKAQLQEIEKAFAELGSPLFRAVVK
jgi:hypothetical protein